MTLDEYLLLHPTPWTVHPCGCQDVCWCRMVKSSKAGDDFIVGAGSLNEVEANLLAAAPEMLAILESLVSDKRWHLNPSGIEQIRRLITSIRGTSHE